MREIRIAIINELFSVCGVKLVVFACFMAQTVDISIKITLNKLLHNVTDHCEVSTSKIINMARKMN